MRTEKTSSLRADLALVGVCAIWGFTFPSTQLALRDTRPLTFICIRFVLASLALGLIFRRRVFRLPRAGWGYGLLLGLFLAAGTVLQTIGLKYTTAPRSAFITALYVVLVPFMMLLIERVRPRLVSIVAVALATVGLYLITSPDASGINLGDLLTVFCAVAFAVHIVLIEMATAKYDPIALAFWQVTIAGSFCLLALPLAEDPMFRLTAWSLTGVLVNSFLATALAFTVQVWAQRETAATHAAVIFTAEPVFATLFAYFLQGATLEPAAILGAGLVLAGIVLIQIRARGKTDGGTGSPS